MTTSEYQTHAKKLLEQRTAQGDWEGQLSSSAVSTATAALALIMTAAEKHRQMATNACQWLAKTQLADGSWGDTPESPANLTASLLATAALTHSQQFPEAAAKAQQYLATQIGAFTPAAIRRAILQKYGRDLTFSVPILALCTAVGILNDSDYPWQQMPQLPFELSLLPRASFRFFNLRVVSYALPALIAIGVAQTSMAKSGIGKALRRRLIPAALRRLQRLQPNSGGFLEAAPLTAFCLLCLSVSGHRQHPVALAAERFLVTTVRADGSWPIDTSLGQWCTSLAATATARTLDDNQRQALTTLISQRQTRQIHPFTGSPPDGWGWNDQSGAVPDADDTSAALIALHALQPGQPTPAISSGCAWLINLQNRDGGIPTFCRGWGKLPFDRSCPDLSAHAFRALELWRPQLTPRLQRQASRCQRRISQYLARQQRQDGSFLPLWFGDQDAPDCLAPVYGTAVVLENLAGQDFPWCLRARDYLLRAQLPSGAWGADESPNAVPRLIFTARAVAALAPWPDTAKAVQSGLDFLRSEEASRLHSQPEPIGLYFSQLWYSEKLYPLIFLCRAYGAAHTR